MRVTFLLPGYRWGPSGGFRMVYEYANQLVARGHDVAVIHPRVLKYRPAEKLTLRAKFQRVRHGLTELYRIPEIYWHFVDPKVKLMYVPSSDAKHIPDADAIFATAFQTVPSVMQCGSAKGKKCYLIQGYETWMGPKEVVDETWRLPLHKVVVSRWLFRLGHSLGETQLTYVPNAIDHRTYRVIRPIEDRPKQVVMVCSPVALKRSPDGIKALEIAKKRFPELSVVLFGASRRPSGIPGWMPYWYDPQQDRIVEDFYNNSSIILSPSLMEGFALPPAEAAACGCAIVSTDSGGIRDYVEHGVTGLLSPPAHPAALAENLCLLLADDRLRVRLAKAARKAVGELTWAKSADLMEEFLGRVVVQRGRVSEPDSSYSHAATHFMVCTEGRNG